MKIRTIIITAILSLFLASNAMAIINPAAAYCSRLGYESEYLDDGSSFCILPAGLKCDQWDFAEGKCGAEYSYCAKKGYQYKTSTDHDACKTIGSECLLCIKPDGTFGESTSMSRSDTDLGPVQDLQDLIPPETTTTTLKPTTTIAIKPITTTIVKPPVNRPICGDGVCETEESCPQDCETPKEVEDMTTQLVWGVLGVVIIIIVIGAVSKSRSS